MNQHKKLRRDLLKILSSIPVGLTVGCSPDQPDSIDRVSPTADDSALGVLVKSIGYWTQEDSAQATAFTARLIASPSGQYYLDEGASLVTSIIGKLPDAIIDNDRIDLSAFTGPERELLLRFIQQFYSYLEVRNEVAGEPVFGKCQADPLFYTRISERPVDDRR